MCVCGGGGVRCVCVWGGGGDLCVCVGWSVCVCVYVCVCCMDPIRDLVGYNTSCVQHACRYEEELTKWRRGDTVPEAEQMSTTKLPSKDDSLTSLPPTPRTGALTPLSSGSDLGRVGYVLPVTPTPESSRAFEEEKAKLCQQIDEKVLYY